MLFFWRILKNVVLSPKKKYFLWLGEKRLDTILAKMLLQSTIYYVRRERNARRHHQTWTSTIKCEDWSTRLWGTWSFRCGTSRITNIDGYFRDGFSSPFSLYHYFHYFYYTTESSFLESLELMYVTFFW